MAFCFFEKNEFLYREKRVFIQLKNWQKTLENLHISEKNRTLAEIK